MIDEEPRYSVRGSASNFIRVGQISQGHVCDLLAEFDYDKELFLPAALAQAARENYEVKVDGDDTSDYYYRKVNKHPLSFFQGMLDGLPVLKRLESNLGNRFIPIIELAVNFKSGRYDSYLYTMDKGKFIGSIER